jgi:hypothetical protein
MKKRNDSAVIKGQKIFAAFFGCVLFSGIILPAHAQAPVPSNCELGTLAVATTLMGANKLLINTGMPAALKAAFGTSLETANSQIDDAQQSMRDDVFAAMKKFSDQWQQDLKDMTAQMSSSAQNQTRQLGTIADNSQINATARRLQKLELKAKRQYKPTEQACVFDTKAKYTAEAKQISRAMQTGLSSDFSKVLVNKKGTPSAGGPATLRKSRWTNYVNLFCDPNSNAGASGCTAPGPLKDAHIAPSKTLFGKETIDINNADSLVAINELIYNITGLEAPEPILPGVLKKTAGQDQRQQNTEYAAQMDVIAALPAMIVAERTPGKPAPEVKASRERLLGPNSDASERPSEKEIRQSRIEELWDAKFYADLPAEKAAERELYLQALGLSQLFRMIEKTETIATAYSAETGNLLRQLPNPTHGAMKYVPSRVTPLPPP